VLNAVNGTVNDLAMGGAEPLYLSAGFILEEGLAIADLKCVAESMRRAADTAGVAIVTGDTKVVERNHGHGVYINTAGIGVIRSGRPIAPSRVQVGDVILLNGDIGRHGIAVIAAREGMIFEEEIGTDCAQLATCVMKLLEAGIDIKCMRDLTRGGLATGLLEISQTASSTLTIEEKAIPVANAVAGACEIMGFDPLYVANEGRFVLIVPENDVEQAASITAADSAGRDCRVIGRVSQSNRSRVVLHTVIGSERLLTMLSGEQLPRIC
jgi:hydrogenase expression/formation protein HypE